MDRPSFKIEVLELRDSCVIAVIWHVSEKKKNKPTKERVYLR